VGQHSVYVDDEVWAELQKRATALKDTPNSVLRKVLCIVNCNDCRFSNEDDLCDEGHTERQPGKADFAPVCPDFVWLMPSSLAI